MREQVQQMIDDGKTILIRWEHDIGYSVTIDGRHLNEKDPIFRYLTLDEQNLETEEIESDSWYEVNRVIGFDDEP